MLPKQGGSLSAKTPQRRTAAEMGYTTPVTASWVFLASWEPDGFRSELGEPGAFAAGPGGPKSLTPSPATVSRAARTLRFL
jgi:hypothetical protein